MTTVPTTPISRPANVAAFLSDRLGMFIHFGLYALAGRHEWVQNRERIAPEVYAKYFEHFDPDLFDAADRARQCKRAGMRYAVLTTKHHEGFCLFDSDLTDYKITNTPFGRDLVAEFVEAFRAEGIKIGFYPSLIDWHHPDFVIDRLDIPGDLVTPEQYQPAEPMRRDGELVAWKAYQMITGSWGYLRDNTLFKTPEMLVQSLTLPIRQPAVAVPVVELFLA